MTQYSQTKINRLFQTIQIKRKDGTKSYITIRRDPPLPAEKRKMINGNFMSKGQIVKDFQSKTGYTKA